MEFIFRLEHYSPVHLSLFRATSSAPPQPLNNLLQVRMTSARGFNGLRSASHYLITLFPQICLGSHQLCCPSVLAVAEGHQQRGLVAHHKPCYRAQAVTMPLTVLFSGLHCVPSKPGLTPYGGHSRSFFPHFQDQRLSDSLFV